MIPLVFVKPIVKPDYDKVLAALHAAQAAEAAQEAAQALAAKKLADAAAAQAAAAQTAVQQAVVAPVSSDYYKQWIYNEESGNDPSRWNSSGCLGVGQACPASKLLAVCPTMDYACEDNFFTNYMVSRYGSWYAAYEFHIANGWW